MNRHAVFLVAVLLGGCITPYQSVESGPRAKVTLTKISTNSPSIPEYKNSPALSTYVYEADGECKMHFKGRVKIEDEERSRAVFLPAGRTYLVVGLRLPEYFTPDGENVSFVLEPPQEYTILYENKGRSSTYMGDLQYKLSYLRGSGATAESIAVDQWSIFQQEKGTIKK